MAFLQGASGGKGSYGQARLLCRTEGLVRGVCKPIRGQETPPMTCNTQKTTRPKVFLRNPRASSRECEHSPLNAEQKEQDLKCVGGMRAADLPCGLAAETLTDSKPIGSPWPEKKTFPHNAKAKERGLHTLSAKGKTENRSRH